jgi:hypothetical protein
MAEHLLWSRDHAETDAEMLSFLSRFYPATNPDKLSDFCLPHASLRQLLPQPVPTNGSGSAQKWRPQAPAMAAGLTDHVWSLCEVLLYRVPPWPQP